MILNSIVTNSPIKITQMTRQNIMITKNGFFDNMMVQGTNARNTTLKSEGQVSTTKTRVKSAHVSRRRVTTKQKEDLNDQERMRVLLSHQSTKYPAHIGVWGRPE